MSAPYYVDDAVTLWHGDSLAVLRTLPDASVNCCVTSPPYFGLRDYGVDGQMGAESSPAEYVAGMRALFSEVRRVLAGDGTLWLNLGDSYASDPGNGRGGGSMLQGRKHADSGAGAPTSNQRKPGVTLARKNLLGIPWRTALALQDDGWILRNAVVWNKTNAMPESMTDRLSSRYEFMFMLSKGARYWFDLDAIREPALTMMPDNPGYRSNGKSDRRRKAHAAPPGQAPQTNMVPTGTRHSRSDAAGRNPGDVWSIPTQPYPGAHFAVMPSALAERCILAGCKPGGVVLDPFSGSGTTGLAGAKHGRRYVGIDLNSEYLDQSLRARLAQPGLDFGKSA